MSSIAEVKASLQIESVELMWVDDDDSKAAEVLGQYSNEPKTVHVDRSQHPGYSEHEFRYWNPVTTDNPDDVMQDYRRHESLCRGEWCYQGCVARAVVSYQTKEGARRLEYFSSGGASGVESDSSPLLLMEIEVSELMDLKAHLTVFGIPWTMTQENILQAAIARLQDTKKQAES